MVPTTAIGNRGSAKPQNTYSVKKLEKYKFISVTRLYCPFIRDISVCDLFLFLLGIRPLKF